MKQQQINKLASFIALIRVCEKAQSTWNGLRAFKEKFQQFTTRTTTLSELRLQQESASTGLPKQKQHCREEACNAAAIAAGAVRAWATDVSNFEVVGKVDYTFSDLSHGQAAASKDRCQAIHDTASEHVQELGKYGVTSATLKDLQAKIDAYENSLVTSGEGRAASKRINQQIADEFKAASKLLINGLDELVLGFEKTDPAFYAEYWNARQVANVPSTRARRAAGTETQPTLPLDKAA